MLVFKLLLALVVLFICVGFSVYWNEAVSPDLLNNQAMKQLEVHKDGTGNRMANERRVITRVSQWPVIAVGLAGVLLIVAMFSSDLNKLGGVK